MSKRNISFLIFFVFITITFFSYNIIVTYDSSHYLWLSSLFSSEGDFSTWDVQRGPVFPFLLKATTKLFGSNINAFVLIMFVFYLAMLLAYYFMHKDILKDIELGTKGKIIYMVLFILLIAINPMIISFYHTLLTEFVAITFAAIGCYLAWKWMKVDFTESKAKYIIFTIAFAVMNTIVWFLKQPYVTVCLFPLGIAALLSVIQNFKFKNIIQRISTLLACAIFLVISINVWNGILKANNVNFNPARTSDGLISRRVLNGLSEFQYFNKYQEISEEEIRKDDRLTDEDKEKIISIEKKQSEYKGYVVLECGMPKYKVVYYKGDKLSVVDSVVFCLSDFVHDPIKWTKNYGVNYLATISVFNIDFSDQDDILIDRHFELFESKEIKIIGYKLFEYGGENMFVLNPLYAPYAEGYRTTNTPIVPINKLMQVLEVPSNICMKVAFLILPVLVIANVVFLFLSRRYNDKFKNIINLTAILFIYSLVHILVYVFLGSTIDRYTLPAIPATYIGIILFAYIIINSKKYRVESNVAKEKNNKKDNNKKVEEKK